MMITHFLPVIDVVQGHMGLGNLNASQKQGIIVVFCHRFIFLRGCLNWEKECDFGRRKD